MLIDFEFLVNRGDSMRENVLQKNKRFSVNKIIDFLSHISVFILVCTYCAYQGYSLFILKGVCMVVLGIRFLLHRKRLNVYMFWSIVFWVLCLSSLIWSVDFTASKEVVGLVLRVFILCNLLLCFIDDKQKMQFVLRCYVVSAVILSIRLASNTPSEILGIQRLGYNINYNPNTLGLYMALGAICSLYLAKECKKVLYYIPSVLFSLIAIFTGSRKAFILIILGFAIYLLLNTKKTLRWAIYIPIAAVAFLMIWKVIIANEILYGIIGYRMETLLDSLFGHGDRLMRMKIIIEGFRLFSDRPLIGYGANTYQAISGFGFYSHNNYIEILVSFGLIGFIVYYSFYCYLYVKLVKRWLNGDRSVAFPLTIIILMLIIESGLCSYFADIFQVFIAICCAYLYIRNDVNVSPKQMKTLHYYKARKAW